VTPRPAGKRDSVNTAHITSRLRLS
jgi:hypothetical protein